MAAGVFPGAAPTAWGATSRQECLIVRDLASGKTIDEVGGRFCGERKYACSSFKLPLAAMAFDAGVLKGVGDVLEWDGTPQLVETWKKNHTPKTWLADSVVWFSQRLTPRIGLRRLRSYLRNFKYGNQDMSGGLTHAWLSSSLKISAREQAAMLRRLKLGQLKISRASLDSVFSILPIGLEEDGLRISGKTGSCFTWLDPTLAATAPPLRTGWYIGYATVEGRELVFATVFEDSSIRGEYKFGGAEAKAAVIRWMRGHAINKAP